MGPATYQFITRPLPSPLEGDKKERKTHKENDKQLKNILKHFEEDSSSPSISLLEKLSLHSFLPGDQVLFIRLARQIAKTHGLQECDILLLAQIILCHRAFPYSCKIKYLWGIEYWLEGEITEQYNEFALKKDSPIKVFPGNESFILLKRWDDELKKELKDESKIKDRLQNFILTYPQILLDSSDFPKISAHNKIPLLFFTGGFIISYGDLNFKNRLETLVKMKISFRSKPHHNDNKDAYNFTVGGHTLNGEQSKAVTHSLSNFLTIITGGPGTGKTTTIAAIIGNFVSQKNFLSTDDSSVSFNNKIALVAPTGKAANRMVENLSLIKNIPQLDVQPVTLHQLLGLNRYHDFPQFNQKKPLNYHLVILDECSMVNLKLMVWLMEAILPKTKIVLIGDTKQLPAIDGSTPFYEIIRWIKGQKNIHFQLTQSHRFTSQIGILTEIIEKEQDGLPEKLKEMFSKESSLRHVEPQNINTERELIEKYKNKAKVQIQKQVQRKRANFSLANSAFEIEYLEQLSNFVFLTSSRMGFWGCDSLNRIFSQHFGEGNVYYEGQPILILENSYSTNLFNGDRGIIVKMSKDKATSHVEDNLVAIFRGVTPETPYRIFPLGQLPKHETSYAMTIHKGQGSEFKEVVLCLTEIGRLEISKELLYTGITRAKNSLSIIAEKEVLSKAVKKTVLCD